jgi:hypothetical protein
MENIKSGKQKNIITDKKMIEGFTMFKDTYAAIPFGKQLMIIYQGQQLKVCKTESSARKFISDHKKGKSVAKLPLD